MSRLTSAQIIALGEYLEPEFNPASLTVSQLLGVLGYHNVPYPTPYTKPKLVALFNDEIKARATKFKKERIKQENSQPSDDGIMDGVTGKPLNAGRKALPLADTPRRSSRRISQAPIEVEDSPPSPPKRRRSSAQPALGGSSRLARKRSTVHSSVAEESEPEEEEVVPLPPRKVGKTKKTTEARAPRISDAFDSGWEDNNIFQSGAESSSPARPSPARKPRTSGIPKKSRKSTSAPPEMGESPVRASPFVPPQSSFTPALGRLPPLKFSPSPQQKPGPFQFATIGHDHEDLNSISEVKDEGSVPSLKEEAEERVVLDDNGQQEGDDVYQDQEDDSEELASSQEPGPSALIQRPERGGILPVLYRLVSFAIMGSLGYILLNYKAESAAIGYCDPGSNTNDALELLRTRRLAAEACVRDNRTTLYLTSFPNSSSNEDHQPCPLPPLIPLPQPNSCTPCPQNATCTQFSVQCENGYIRRPYSLLRFLPDPPPSYNESFSSSMTPSEVVWTGLSTVLDGLPGLGSVALPPRCLPDPKRQRNIGVLGKAIESVLAQERGHRLCIGGEALDREYRDSEGGDARKWGIELEDLRNMMKRKMKTRLHPAFDDTFDQAISELVQWGAVVLGADSEGHRYLASKDADLTWDCVLTVKSRELWETWRTTVIGGAVALLVGVVVRRKLAQKKSESRRVSELVQIALNELRNQELAHHTDPVSVPQPYLSSIQLRDYILQNEHSIPTRRRLWDQVEHIVEGNANVRANLEEIEGGDELRVWRWVGSTGRGLM